MMIGTIYINGEIGVDTTLLDVIKQVKNQSAAESFLVKIDSQGGYVDSGKDIYNYLVNLSVPISTISSRSFSIASYIFLAGSTRIIPEGAENALMIHLPWMEAVGNHQLISDYLKDLKATEDELVDFYSKALDLDKNTVHSLLTQETYLNATQALELGFATQLQPAQMAVAKLHNENTKDESLMNKINAKLETLMNLISGKTAVKAELVLQDATGVSITFPTLSGSDVPAEGDKAMIDGKPAEGDFTMPDGTIVTFKGGIVEAVTAVEVPVEETEPVAADADAEEIVEETPEDEKDAMIAELEAKVVELQSKLDEMMTSAQAENLLDMVAKVAEQSTELEAKYVALAKSVSSDFQAEVKDTKTNLKAGVESASRASQILNSKF